MDTPGFIQPPPWLLPSPDDDAATPDDTQIPSPSPVAIPAFRPMPLGTLPEAVTAAVHPRWRLLLVDGQGIDLVGTVVLGRDPAPVASHPGAELVRLRDLDRSVSKTHAVIEIDGDRLRVTNLHSTNGVSVRRADGHLTGIAPGGTGELERGCRLMLGEFALDVGVDGD